MTGLFWTGKVVVVENTIKLPYYRIHMKTNMDFDFNTGVKSNLTLTAYYAANTDTEYKVIIHKQHIYDDDYDIETSTLYGTTDTTATYSPLNYVGFALMDEISTTSGNIEPDGSLELHLYYDRYEFNVEFETNINGVTLDTETVRYGAKLPDPNLSRDGYTFSGWYDQFDRTFIFGSTEVVDNLTLTAYWDANTDTEFRVEFIHVTVKQYPNPHNTAIQNIIVFVSLLNEKVFVITFEKSYLYHFCESI